MPKRPNAIALFFATTEKSGKVLEPENLFYLFPDSIYSCFEEGSGKQSFLLKLAYGRPYADAERFMAEVMRVYPLLIQTYAVYVPSNYHAVTAKARDILERPNATTWNLKEQCRASEYGSAEVFFAWIMTKVIRTNPCTGEGLMPPFAGHHAGTVGLGWEEEEGGNPEAKEGLRLAAEGGITQPSTNRRG